MQHESSEIKPKVGIMALAAYLLSLNFVNDTKDAITNQIVGFGRAIMFSVLGDGDPMVVYHAYARKVTEFGIPEKESMLKAIQERCLQARELWLENLFITWTSKLGTIARLEHNEAIEVIKTVGAEIIGLSPSDLVLVMKENERHGLAAIIRGATLIHQFDGSPHLADKVAQHLGVLTIVEPMGEHSVHATETGTNGTSKHDGVEIGPRIPAATPTIAATA